MPIPEQENGADKFRITPRVFQPYNYDLFPDPNNEEKALLVITSNYEADNTIVRELPIRAGGVQNLPKLPLEVAADPTKDPYESVQEEMLKQERYIWWTKSFHFTTDGRGEIVKEDAGEPRPTLMEKIRAKVLGANDPEIKNEIGQIPFVFFAIDQDGHIYAIGGDDVVDGAVLLNCMITNVLHIGVTQGYGQFWWKGEEPPQHIKLGPNKAILLKYRDGQAEPDIGFATASPPLEELRMLIEMYAALLLTSNNLSTSGVSTSLQGTAAFASGIALMFDKAESLEDVEDQRELFRDKDAEPFYLFRDWHKVLNERRLLVDDQAGLVLAPDTEINTKFLDPKLLQSESEKLDNLSKRKDLGINTMVDLIRIDDPGLSEKDAEAKLEKILKEQINRQAQALIKGEDAASEPCPTCQGTGEADTASGKCPDCKGMGMVEKEMPMDEKPSEDMNGDHQTKDDQPGDGGAD